VLGYLINPEPMMVMEIYPNNLNTIIYEYNLTLDAKKMLTHDIISGLMYLHSLPLIHRDLKPANILLTNEYRAKISDFGTAKVITNSMQSSVNMLVGTPYYMAPEIIQQYKYSVASDLYALGIIIYEIFEQKQPFYYVPEFNANTKDLPSPFVILTKILKDRLRPIMSSETFPELKVLIQKLLDENPANRTPLLETDNTIKNLKE